MKLVVCGSMAFSKEMLDIKHELEGRGIVVVLPEGSEQYVENTVLRERAAGPGSIEGAHKKIKEDLIRKHFREIEGGDAILVVNKTKGEIENYIGGNSFLEMGFAYVLGKEIFVLNSLPETPLIHQELVAMQPVVLEGDIEKILKNPTS